MYIYKKKKYIYIKTPTRVFFFKFKTTGFFLISEIIFDNYIFKENIIVCK